MVIETDSTYDTSMRSIYVILEDFIHERNGCKLP